VHTDLLAQETLAGTRVASVLTEEIVCTKLDRQAVAVTGSGEQPTTDEIVDALTRGKAIDWDSEGGVRIRDVQPADDPGDLTTAEPAVDAAGWEWLYVEAFADDKFDMEVGFSDPFVADHDTEMEQCVEFVRSLPGVSRAFRQDPEQILIVGTRDARRIRDSLVVWFAERA